MYLCYLGLQRYTVLNEIVRVDGDISHLFGYSMYPTICDLIRVPGIRNKYRLTKLSWTKTISRKCKTQIKKIWCLRSVRFMHFKWITSKKFLFLYLLLRRCIEYPGFVSDLRKVGGFLRVLRFPPPIKLTATI